MRSLLLAALLLAGCMPDGPRQAPFPVFDARAPFPELGRSATSAPKKAEPDGTGFEEALAELEPLQPAEPQAEEAGPHESVSLHPGFAGTIPTDAAWRVTPVGNGTKIVYQPPGAPEPLAMIFAEPFSAIVQMSPSAELQRFLRKINPSMMPPIALLDMPTASNETATLDWAFESSPKSFSGWRWVGRNPNDVELRMARVTGSWIHNAAPQQPAELQDVLGGLPVDLGALGVDISALEQLQDLGADTLVDTAEQPVNRTPPRDVPAWMIFGNARVSDGIGLHLAVLCDHRGGCPVANELSDFLQSLSSIH